ncbi:uncharacterized protein isoform X1 [Choristoneura fumiferana]|uniref:uncharacterized protein isoform X1 n=1 Tax=Choristoneura fumiferana TaxID=7141 RepID=UPI003D159C08
MGKEKSKKRQRSTSTSSSSSSSSDSSREKKKLRKLKKKLKKEQKRTEKILKKKLKEEKKKLKKKDRSSKSRSREESSSKVEEAADIPIELMEKSRAMAPMTKEEWEQKQSVVRRVLDEESGRYRLSYHSYMFFQLLAFNTQGHLRPCGDPGAHMNMGPFQKLKKVNDNFLSAVSVLHTKSNIPLIL